MLIVDDEVHILSSYKLSLKSFGINNVLTVSDSSEVIPLLEAQPIALIILDLYMPHISGLDLLARINRDFPQIPVILVSSNDEIETVVSGFANMM